MPYTFVAGNTVEAAMGQSALPRLARFIDSSRSNFARLLKNDGIAGAVLGIPGLD